MASLQSFLKARLCKCSTTLRMKRFISSTTILNGQKSVNDEENDKPIKFSTSGARSYKAFASFKSDINSRLWYEPYVILGSLSVFLLYFTVLREENDLDEELMLPLYKRIEGLEEKQLEAFIEHGSGSSKELNDAKSRLEQIKNEKC